MESETADMRTLPLSCACGSTSVCQRNCASHTLDFNGAYYQESVHRIKVWDKYFINRERPYYKYHDYSHFTNYIEYSVLTVTDDNQSQDLVRSWKAGLPSVCVQWCFRWLCWISSAYSEL